MARVIKLAQPGFDVKTASDENLIFSSEWPMLKIYKQDSSTLTSDGAIDNIIVDHDLGYVPMFLYFNNNIINNQLNNATPEFLTATITERSDFNSPGGQYTAKIDTKSLRLVSTASFKAPAQIYYYIYALDITTAYNAPIIKLGKQPKGTPPTNVFKIVKPGQSLKSTNLEDYIIHSNSRSLLIHSVVPITSPATPSDNAYYHKLGYTPIFFLYAQEDSGKWFLSNQFGSATIQVDDQKITVATTSVINFSLVVLKDPFDIDYQVQVNL